MKYIVMIVASLMLAFAPAKGMNSQTADAAKADMGMEVKGKKEIRVLVVTTTPEMHCKNCEKKIKENIRFEPGVRNIETSLERQQVTITYNAAKTDAKKLCEAMAKIGYTAKVVSDQPEEQAQKNDKKAPKK